MTANPDRTLSTEILQGFLDGIRPEPRITVSEWADENRVLGYTSAKPGLWRTSETPYLREIMDKLTVSDPCQEVVFMKGSQIGATEAGLNWLGYIIDIAPASTMMVMPTTETVKRNSKLRIDTLIENCPTLRKKIGGMKSKDRSNTLLQKNFPGGTLAMTGANSAAGLRSMPVKFLFLDEVDNYPLDVDNEGSPVDLAKARTRTFARRKHFLCSTPVTKHLSVIEPAFLSTDQRYYFVPCPHCEHMQHLVHDQLRWKKGEYRSVKYECTGCGEEFAERHKTKILAAGEWRATHPENASAIRVGYHLNALYSPLGMYSWSEFAEEWDDALQRKDVAKQKVLTNTVLGKTYEEQGERPEWETLYERRESYAIGSVSSSVCFLTAGVDVQKDRLEVEVVGWCTRRESYSVDYIVLLGATNEAPVWSELGALLTRQWETDGGVWMPISRMAIDSGYNTSHVYDFCRRYSYDQVMPIKGQDTLMMPLSRPTKLDLNRKGKGVGFVMLWQCGVSFIKSEIYGNLNAKIDHDTGEIPFGYCHFPQYQASYFKGLTAEKLIPRRTPTGFIKHVWEKLYERNEPLDCRVYARAAASAIGYDRMSDEQVLAMRQSFLRTTTKKKKKRRSDWL